MTVLEYFLSRDIGPSPNGKALDLSLIHIYGLGLLGEAGQVDLKAISDAAWILSLIHI